MVWGGGGRGRGVEYGASGPRFVDSAESGNVSLYIYMYIYIYIYIELFAARHVLYVKHCACTIPSLFCLCPTCPFAPLAPPAHEGPNCPTRPRGASGASLGEGLGLGFRV